MVNKNLKPETLRQGMCVWTSVKSVEDYGYVLSLRDEHSGFLTEEAARPFIDGPNKGKHLIVGQPLFAYIYKPTTDDRTLRFTSQLESEATPGINDGSRVVRAATVKPGMLVSARIKNILPTGLFVQFWEGVSGFVERWQINERLKSFALSQVVVARVVHVSPSNLTVRLSLKPHLCSATPSLYHFPSEVQPGSPISAARVIFAENVPRAVFLRYRTDRTTPPQTVVAMQSDTDAKNVVTAFKDTKTLHDGRVLWLNSLDGLVVATLRKEDLVSQFLLPSDAAMGQIVEGKITEVSNAKGITLRLSARVTARCPIVHLYEQNPEGKLAVGRSIRGRVLNISPKGYVTVTTLPEMLQSDLPILASYEEVVPGARYDGVVTAVERWWCVVTFYSAVRGTISLEELAEPLPIDSHSVVKVGEVVRCRVVSCVPDKRHLKLSLLQAPVEVPTQNAKDDDTTLVGKVFPGTVLQRLPEGLIVSLHADDGVTFDGLIATQHLSDHTSNCEKLLAAYDKGDNINDVLVLSVKQEGDNLTPLSAKPSLTKAALQKTLPSSLDDVVARTLVHGYVKSVMKPAVIVGFLGTFAVLVPKSRVADELVKSAADCFSVGQSVTAFVQMNHKKSQKCKMNLKPSQCVTADPSFIQSYFAEQRFLATHRKAPCVDTGDIVRIGAVVSAEVREVKPYGSILRLPQAPTITGFVTEFHADGKTLKVGQQLKAVVLDIDRGTNVADVSLKSALVRAFRNDTSKATPSLGTKQDCVIELVKEHYVVASLPHLRGCLGFFATRDYNRAQSNTFAEFQAGEHREVTIAHLPSGENGDDRLLLKLYGVATPHRLQDVIVGNEYDCTVKHVAEYGVFLRITSTGLSGLCPIIKLSASAAEIVKTFESGKKVTAKVTAVNKDKPKHKRITFIITEKNFRGEDIEREAGENKEEEGKKGSNKKKKRVAHRGNEGRATKRQKTKR
eukprot:TRINITY_DN1938_c0_g1_i3.p1 TRINITY_DN1938_c0_g1~~TRINITY_DN1938_c0_g1_i3.p1  ORF type:complete len:959 (+),score=163.82 TRINITY_DN1938_c0_g1_i3:596-3472(+)